MLVAGGSGYCRQGRCRLWLALFLCMVCLCTKKSDVMDAVMRNEPWLATEINLGVPSTQTPQRLNERYALGMTTLAGNR